MPQLSVSTARTTARNLPAAEATKLIRVGSENLDDVARAFLKLSDLTNGNIKLFVNFLESNAHRMSDVIRQPERVESLPDPVKVAFTKNPDAFAKLRQQNTIDDVYQLLSSGAVYHGYADDLVALVAGYGDDAIKLIGTLGDQVFEYTRKFPRGEISVNALKEIANHIYYLKRYPNSGTVLFNTPPEKLWNAEVTRGFFDSKRSMTPGNMNRFDDMALMDFARKHQSYLETQAIPDSLHAFFTKPSTDTWISYKRTASTQDAEGFRNSLSRLLKGTHAEFEADQLIRAKGWERLYPPPAGDVPYDTFGHVGATGIDAIYRDAAGNIRITEFKWKDVPLSWRIDQITKQPIERQMSRTWIERNLDSKALGALGQQILEQIEKYGIDSIQIDVARINPQYPNVLKVEAVDTSIGNKQP